MIDLKSNPCGPGLLVSVRNADEALAALTAGADVIDVKEPTRGSLGAADAESIAAVVRIVDGRAPVTAALGELVELVRANSSNNARLAIPAGVALFKVGLAGCSQLPNWKSQWREFIASLRGANRTSPPQPVAVVYADWQAAAAPSPDEILQAAVQAQCPGLLIDTWSKTTGDLFTHWLAEELHSFLECVREQQLFVVLAGSLNGESFHRAVQMSPDLVAVRTAACESDRNSQVSASRVRNLKLTIATNSSPRPQPRPTATSTSL